MIVPIITGHDSAFSLARTELQRSMGSKAGSAVVGSSKRSPSQSSSGLGSDGNSSVGSAVQAAPPVKTSTTLQGLKQEGSQSLPGSPRHRPLQVAMQPAKQNLWSKLPCFGGNIETDMA